jgi:hypothetical protein
MANVRSIDGSSTDTLHFIYFVENIMLLGSILH